MRLRGRLSIDSSPASVISFWPCCEDNLAKAVVVDMTEVSYIDASGVATLVEGLKIARSRQNTLCLKGLQGRVLRLFEVTGLLHLFETNGCRSASTAFEGVLMATVLEDVGRRTISELDYVGSLNIQLWATLRAMGSALPFVGNRYRWQASVRQMLQIGVDALPMVALMAICTGFILAMQGASELRRFGAIALRHRSGCRRLHA